MRSRPIRWALGTVSMAVASMAAVLVPACEEQAHVSPLPPTEIVLIVESRTDERSATMIRAAQEEIKNDLRTVVRVVAQDASPTSEAGHFAPSTAIAAVLLTCKPWPGINPSIVTASQLNVPVFLLGDLYGTEEKPYGWKPALVFTTLDDMAANRAGKALFGLLEQRHLLEKRSMLVVLRGGGGDPVDRLRAKGYERRMLLASPKLRELEPVVVIGGREAAQRQVGQLLVKHDNLRAVLCTNESLALGAADAIGEADRSGRVLIAGLGLSAEAEEAIRADRIQVGVDFRSGKMASRAARFALNYDQQHGSSRLGTKVLHTFNIVTAKNVPTAPAAKETVAGDPTLATKN